MPREFSRRGLGYVLNAPDVLTDISVGRLTNRGGDTYGEVTVECGLLGTRSSDGVLHQARLNLTSTSARVSLAKLLTARSNAPDIDWQDLLEDFCRRVLASERAGEPVEMAGARPPREEQSWRLHPILAADKPTIIYGEGGSGKSTIATAIAVSVETGVTIIDGWLPRRAPVLYLDWEATVDDLDEHVKAIAAGAHIPHAVEIRYRRCYRPLADQAEEVASVVHANQVGLVIVDSVALAAGTSAEGSDASEGAIRLFAAFRLLGTTVLALAHVSKADQSDGSRPARPYGSVFYTNLARSTFELKKSGETDSNRVALFNTKTNVSRPLAPFGLEILRSEGVIEYREFDLAEDPTLSKRLTIWDRARAALLAGPQHERELSLEIGATEGSIRTILSRKVADGLVSRVPGGWKLVDR